MALIIYDKDGEDATYSIDSLSQQVLTYLSFYGSAEPATIASNLNVSENGIQTRIESQIGLDAASLISLEEQQQMRFDDEGLRSSYHLRLTEAGTEFVYRHHSILETPTSFESIAHTLSTLERDVGDMDDLRMKYQYLSERVEELEDMVGGLRLEAATNETDRSE
ncbi:hypothetical protein ACFQE8_07070 [Salinirubellus sp. GCM10025818]|uniref:hypothetical protein n=1 Tax=Salinirubellus TaxID=2162630 RepID=UPI0030D51397